MLMRDMKERLFVLCIGFQTLAIMLDLAWQQNDCRADLISLSGCKDLTQV